jgi:hypothetical protein
MFVGQALEGRGVRGECSKADFQIRFLMNSDTGGVMSEGKNFKIVPNAKSGRK